MYLESIFFMPVEFRCTIYCYGNNAAMATEKYLYDYATRWATKLFLTKSCAEIIASGASCLILLGFQISIFCRT